MSNIPLTPEPCWHDTAVQLRQLALRLMDAADLYEEGKGEEGERRALEVARGVREVVHPSRD